MSDENVDVMAVEGEAEARPMRPLLSEADEAELGDFLFEELRLAELERVGEEKRWATIRRQRYGEPEFEKKDTPWPDASNNVPPGMMIAQNTVFGTMKNAYGGRVPFWSVKAFRKNDQEDVRVAKTVERYMQLLADSRSDLNKREVDRELLEEFGLMGTVFVKVPWTTHTQDVPTAAPDGTLSHVKVMFHDGPEWIVVPREDAYFRTRDRSVQQARWWAHKIELEESEVQERFASGKWQEWEGWENAARMTPTLIDDQADKMAGAKAQERKVWDFYETFIRFDLSPKDGVAEELVVVFHRESRTIVMARLNEMGVRMVRELNFIKRARRLDGFGVGHAAWRMQAELETQHNQRMDSVHMSGLRMLVARKNCGIKPREVLKPGKVLFVDNLKEDVMPFQVGEVYPSSLQAESLTWQYLQKASLMTDTMAGFADQTMKSRDSIGLSVQRMKASSGIVGAILESGEDGYSDLGLMTFYQLVFNKERVMRNERAWQRLDEQELADLESALSIPLDQVPVRLIFSVRTTDVEQTYEQRRQNMLALINIYSMFQKMNLPLVVQLNAANPQTGQPMLDPEAKKFVMRLITGNSRMMQKMLEFFDEDLTEEYVPSYEKMELVLDIQDAIEGRMIERLKEVRNAVERAGEGSSGTVAQAPGGLAGPRGPAGLPFPVDADRGNYAGGGNEAGQRDGGAGALPVPGMQGGPA